MMTDFTQASNEEKNWGVFCHLATFVGLLMPVIGHFGGPGLIWLLKKNEFPFVADQGIEVLNFLITLLLISLIAGLLTIVAIGFFILYVLPFYWCVLTIIAVTPPCVRSWHFSACSTQSIDRFPLPTAISAPAILRTICCKKAFALTSMTTNDPTRRSSRE